MSFLRAGAVALFLSLPAAVHAEALPAPLEKSLRGYDLNMMTLDKGVLRLAYRRPVVKFDQFAGLVENGACMPLLMDQKGGWGRAAIDRIEVRTNAGTQGYAIGGARKVCTDIGGIAGGSAKVREYLVKVAEVCVAGDCRPRRPGEKTSGDE